MKRGSLSATYRRLLSVPSGNAGIQLQNDLTLRLYSQSPSVSVVTAAVLRDPSAWYHIVVVLDTPQATTAKIYINGVLQTVSGTYPGANVDLGINNNVAHYLGSYDGSDEFFDGYLADIHFIDGQALTPSSFTEVSATTGQLIPKTYTGTFGTNGFWLKFSDNSAATAATLGNDYSGNNNDWTPNNFSVTQGTGSYTTNTTGTFAANRGAIKAFDGATSGSDFYAQPADGNTVTIGSLGITGITQLRMWLGKNNSGDPWGTLTLNATNVTSFLTTNYPSLTSTGQWIDLTSQLPGSTLSTITMTSPVANTDVRLSAVEVNGIVLIDRAASTTAGNDSLVDTPTSYGTDTGVGGEVRGNYCTWNPLAKNSAITLANGNLDTSNSGGASDGFGLATIAASTGKFYWEVTVNTASAGRPIVGVVPTAAGLVEVGSGNANSVGYRNTGAKRINGSDTSYGNSYTNGDVIGVALDLDNGAIYFSKNGTFQNSGSPTSGSSKTGAAHTWTGGSVEMTPGISEYSSNCSTNWGSRAFAYTAPSGFKALCDTNLGAPLVAKPNTLMDVALYTGTGAAQSITGLAFNPDFVWLKRRSSAQAHYLYDVIRGTSSVLFSDGTDAEQSISTGLTAFNSDGFSLGSLSGVNASSTTNVAWAWDAGTSTVSNTQGSITSQVRANVSAGFSVVTYTGTGANATVGHGLGVAPSMVIVKSRSFSQVWVVGHSSIGFGNYLLLNATDASAAGSNVFNSTAPTSTVFSLGTGTGGNQSAATYVAYCFAPVVGYSSMGSYVGNGSSDGVFVYTGFRPRWVMIKLSSTAGNPWLIFDSARSTYNVVGNKLAPNSAVAEDDASIGNSTQNTVDFLSNGFKPRTADNGTNGSTFTYIYYAVAENPFQYARAR